MDRKPLSKDAGIFAAGLGKRVASKSALFIILTLTGFYIGNFVQISPDFTPSYEIGITMAFMTLSWASILNMFNVRSRESIFKSKVMSNPMLLGSILVSAMITAIVTLVVPLQGLFGLTTVSLYHWLIAIGLAILQVIVIQFLRLFTKV